MNIANLRKFVKALDELPNEIKQCPVNMCSFNEPEGDIYESHGALIGAVDLPELRALYKADYYAVYLWGDALGKYLGFEDSEGLECWARDNPKLACTLNGYGIFSSSLASHQEEDGFPQFVIINWRKSVLSSYEKLAA